MNDEVDAFGLHDFGETFAGTPNGDIHAVQAEPSMQVEAFRSSDRQRRRPVRRPDDVDDVGADVAAPPVTETVMFWPFLK